jgi:uncharacterized protein DUF5681
MTKKDDPVGYGKPPKHTQFKPGQSGNPKGRPKGIQNLNTDLEQELAVKILVTEGGAQQETTKQRAMLKSLFAKALNGDVRASGVLINLILGLEQTRIASQSTEAMAEEDLAILKAFKQKILNQSSPKGSDDHE